MPNTDTDTSTPTRPLRVAICGEVSSGKSALANAIARGVFLPDLFGITHNTVLRLSHDAEHNWTGVFADGNTRELDPESPLPFEEGLSELVVQATSKTDHMKGIDLIELPAFNAETVTDDEIAQIAECDVLIWTTIGSQAWRLSEKTILDEFGTLLPKSRILVATRADKFRSSKDREKVEARLESETSDYFGAGHLLGVPPKLFLTPDDEDSWSASGASDFVALIAQTLSLIHI